MPLKRVLIDPEVRRQEKKAAKRRAQRAARKTMRKHRKRGQVTS